MYLLSSLAGLLGFELETITEQAKRKLIAGAVMAVLGLFGLIFLVIAGFLAVAEQLGPIIAALIFGGTFLLLTLAVYLGTRIGESKRQREAAERRRSSQTSTFLTSAAITALPLLLKSPWLRTLGLPAAALAAFLVAANSGDDEE
jgi:threonine/homoserine/homoserine lactone efflux protein